LGAEVIDGSGLSVLAKLDATLVDLGFTPYTDGSKSTIDVFAITMALMIGTAGLPHVIVRFFTVPKVSDARLSAGYALLFIAILYTTAPAVGAFARLNFVETVHDTSYTEVADWFKSWEDIGLIGWQDKNGDGKIQYHPGAPFEGKPTFRGRASDGSRQVTNASTDSDNEVYVDRDIMVLANPEIAALPAWVIALVAAGGLAAALSTAAGLLLVISASVSHDLFKKTFARGLSDKQELRLARISAAVAVVIAGYYGIYPFGFVAQVVAFAFGLAAASLFPAILLGIFDKRMNKEGAIAGMVVGLSFTATYIYFFKLGSPELNTPDNWLFGISPEGIGMIGAIVNFTVALIVSRLTADVPDSVRALVNDIRIPKGVERPHTH
jgi:cation/acetate symporter